MGHEQVVLCHDDSAGYRGVIAIHSTTLGPALGGTRFWKYASDEEAIVDALRLSRGMTYKNAVAGLNLGGRQSGHHRRQQDARPRDALSRARPIRRESRRPVRHGRGCRHQHRRHGLRPHGDRLCHRAHRSLRRSVARDCARRVPRDSGVREMALGRRRPQRPRRRDSGCGHVGYYLAQELQHRRREAHRHRHRRRTGQARRYRLRCDGRSSPTTSIASKPTSLRPCALGGIINDKTMPQLRVEIVAGAANNQLLEDRHGDALEERGNPLRSRLRGECGWSHQRVQRDCRVGARRARCARPTRSTRRCFPCSRSRSRTRSRRTTLPIDSLSGVFRRSDR